MLPVSTVCSHAWPRLVSYRSSNVRPPLQPSLTLRPTVTCWSRNRDVLLAQVKITHFNPQKEAIRAIQIVDLVKKLPYVRLHDATSTVEIDCQLVLRRVSLDTPVSSWQRKTPSSHLEYQFKLEANDYKGMRSPLAFLTSKTSAVVSEPQG